MLLELLLDLLYGIGVIAMIVTGMAVLAGVFGIAINAIKVPAWVRMAVRIIAVLAITLGLGWTARH